MAQTCEADTEQLKVLIVHVCLLGYLEPITVVCIFLQAQSLVDLWGVRWNIMTGAYFRPLAYDIIISGKSLKNEIAHKIHCGSGNLSRTNCFLQNCQSSSNNALTLFFQDNLLLLRKENQKQRSQSGSGQ